MFHRRGAEGLLSRLGIVCYRDHVHDLACCAVSVRFARASKRLPCPIIGDVANSNKLGALNNVKAQGYV